MSVSYGGESITFADNSTISSGWTGFKNRVINGGMVIDQRYNGASNVVSTVITKNYTVDRFNLNLSDAGANGKMSFTQSTDVPTIEPFTKSLHIQTTTSWPSPSGNYDAITHNIEGYNIVDLRWGTSYAATVTLSFWVKSNVTGTHYVSLSNTNDASYVASYTINSTDTWEKKTITVVGPTTGTWNSTNSTGIWIGWDLGSNTNNNATVNSWNTGFYRISGSTGNTGFRTLGAYIKLTGVQLEKGSTASSFEWRPYGTELQLCQRYHMGGHGSSSSVETGPNVIMFFDGISYASGKTVRVQVPMKVPMRAAPSAQFSNNSQYGKCYFNGAGATIVQYDTGKEYYQALATCIATSSILDFTTYFSLDAEL